MSKKDDMMAALQHKQPKGSVPFWELHFHCWEVLSGKRFISGKDFMKLSERERKKAIEEDAEIIVSVSEDLGFAAVTIPDNPWDCIYTLPNEYRLELARQILDRTNAIMVVAGGGGVISMPSSENYVDFCYKLFDAPDEIDEKCCKTFEIGVENLKRFADAGVKAVYTASDMADNRGPFFNPSQMERYILPYLLKWVEETKSLGVYSILHTDGNVTSLMPDIISTGVQAIQAIDPISGMNIKNVNHKFKGQICICGNMDCGLLLTGSPAQIYTSARDIILNCKSEGSFVFGSSNAVTIETPVENYLAMVEAWKEYGRY